jgi:quercetin 2,3-dioxygenase
MTSHAHDSKSWSNGPVFSIPPGDAVVGLGGYTVKPVIKKFEAIRQQEEENGFIYRRAVGGVEISGKEADPFLLLDELGPCQLNKGEYPGTPWHPHRGLNKVTYVLHGEGAYEDTGGSTGTLRDGDVQWLTAGSGLELTESNDHPGGWLHAFQVWVNLPSRLKMVDPCFQDLCSDNIPIVQIKKGLECKILAGVCHRKTASIQTPVECQILDFHATNGAEFTHIIPVAMTTCIIYVYHGGGQFGAQGVGAVEGDTLLFGPGDSLRFKCDSVLSAASKTLYPQDLRFICLAGVPFAEPVHKHGGIVMNTQEELRVAIKEYEQDTFIKAAAKLLRKS